jgi:hypothetical protein
MFISVLFGMQQANEGIHRMKGYPDEGFKEALHVAKDPQGELEVSLLGDDINSHDLQKKQEELEKMKAYNLFSSMGKKIAESFSKLAEKTAQEISDWLNHI